MTGRVAVLGAYGGEFEQALAFLRKNIRRFPFERAVSHVFPLERISDGFRQADWRERQGDPLPLRISRAAIAM